jgi:nitroreductase
MLLLQHFCVAIATWRYIMSRLLDAIFQRRAVKVFDPVPITSELREQILNAARSAPSSFNVQPYKLIWVESPELRKQAAHLCMSQSPARTASALVVAVADIGSWRATLSSQLEWMRSAGFSAEKICEQEKKSGFAKWFFLQGWFGFFGILKWLILRVVNSWKIIGSLPVARQGLFKWATKSTALACENLMIAAEALGLNTCPMEGFDGRRLSKFLNLSRRYHEIVMVIAIGKKSASHNDSPQWRRPLDTTVQFL